MVGITVTPETVGISLAIGLALIVISTTMPETRSAKNVKRRSPKTQINPSGVPISNPEIGIVRNVMPITLPKIQNAESVGRKSQRILSNRMTGMPSETGLGPMTIRLMQKGKSRRGDDVFQRFSANRCFSLF
jgi:hypothetical protein